MIKNLNVRTYLNKFDFIFLCETHSTTDAIIDLPGYHKIHNPCRLSKDVPRGGCVMFVRNELATFLKASDISFNDAITLYLSNGCIISGIYIPPCSSPYFKDHIDFLETTLLCAEENGNSLIICGDLNSRMGNLDNLNDYRYCENADTEINQHGKEILRIVKSRSATPLNMLNINGKHFDGGITFRRGEAASQNDWFICNEQFLPFTRSLDLHRDVNMSDHIPISTEFETDLGVSWNQIKQSITDILHETNNHSRKPVIRMNGIIKDTFCHLLNQEVENKIFDETDTETTLTELRDIFYDCAKRSKVPQNRQHTDSNIQLPTPNDMSIATNNRNEHAAWSSLMALRDPKLVWEKIDWSGKVKGDSIEVDATVNEFADFLGERCSLPGEHSTYHDIHTNVTDPLLDSRITEEEVLNVAGRMKSSSKAKCGIPIPLFMLVITTILPLLTKVFNKIFLSKYPSCWSAVMNCLPKKGLLNIPNVRGIGLKDLFAKLYDAILKRRLQTWLDIPEEQTAYQKFKGCFMHVFFVRCLTAVCQKLKISLFIGITDFEAAFDKISRRNLFLKLVNMGISTLMLRALIEMYSVTESYVAVNGEYSKVFNMTAGVLQGAATSTVLYMAYTGDLVKIFREKFPIEEVIHLYHILLHADDCLILSTSKEKLVEKFKCLEQYCIDNNIRLQPKKCSFLAINSSETDSIVLENGVIACANKAVYLGSILTAAGNVNSDVAAEIKEREKQFSRFQAFLRENYNAPLSVKEKVLDACVTSAVLHNCETWGNANISTLETLYRKALKYMLGVRKTVCNEFPFIELARPTLTSIIQRRQYKFYKNCTQDRDWPLLRHIIRQAMDARCSFVNHYIKLMERYNSADEITEKSLQDMRDAIRFKAGRGQSRYLSYIALNPTLNRPDIYDSIVPTYKLHHTTRIRMISHSLQIELGRQKRPPTPADERLCVCGEVETEKHFTQQCNLYTHIRHEYEINEDNELANILNTNFTYDYITELHNCREIFTRRT